VSFTFTEGQEKALGLMRDVIKGNRQEVAVINGFAGSGKTTLLKVLAEEYNGNLTVVTPTGKAAQRVREVAPVNAMTIHRWLYWPEEGPNGEVSFKLRQDHEAPQNNVIIIDEASMVSREVWEDLSDVCFFMGVSIIAIGDGFQLPPVNDKEDTFSLLSPDFQTGFGPPRRVDLTEVVRQALDNPIIRISMAIRESQDFGRALKELPAVHRNRLNESAHQTWERGGAIICHRNATRHQVNREIRAIRGLKGISANEPLLVLKNNYALDRFNGEAITLEGITDVVAESSTVKHKGKSTGVRFLEARLEGGAEAIIGEEEILGLTDEMGFRPLEIAARRAAWAHYDEEPYPPYLHASFGYSLTAHKAQGSEFPSVLVLMEPSVKLFSPQGRRWAYTAISRTRGECTLCWLL